MNLLADLGNISTQTLFWLVVLAGFVGMVFFSTVILLKTNYKRCSSNQVLVIFGKTSQGQAAKTVHGGAAFVITSGCVPTATVNTLGTLTRIFSIESAPRSGISI